MIKSDANQTSASNLSARYRPPTDKRYIFFAFLASILLAMSQTIRAVASYDIFSTKFSLSATYLLTSSLYFIFLKVKAKHKNEVFYAPWYVSEMGHFKSIRILLDGTEAENEIFVFNAKLFWIFVAGGTCEFMA